MHPIESAESPPPERRPPHGTSGRAGVARVVLLCVALVAAAVAVQLGGWDGPQRLQAAVESAGPAGAAVFVLGYAVLVLIPSPASVLTVLAGALFGLGAGIALAWAGAVLGAFGGFVIGRLLGRDAIDRMLGGRLADADRVLRSHGLAAVLAVRLLPLFPFTAINYAAGLLRVRPRDYALGTAVGILPGATAYAAVGASGAQPFGIVVGVSALLLLVLGGGWFARRLLGRTQDVEPPHGPQP